MTRQPASPKVTRRRFLGAPVAGPAAIATTRATAQTKVPAFEVSAQDIARIHDLGGRLHIALTPPATGRFAEFTGKNAGRLARVTAGGVILVEAVVRIQIDSGLFSSEPLDDATRGRVFRLLTGG